MSKSLYTVVCILKRLDSGFQYSAESSFHLVSLYDTGDIGRWRHHSDTSSSTASQNTAGTAVPGLEPIAEVRADQCRLERDSGGDVGLVGKDQLLQTTDELVIWDGQCVQREAKHTRNDISQVYQLHTAAQRHCMQDQ